MSETGAGRPQTPEDVTHQAYLDVFGRFWDGMSYLGMSSKGIFDRLAAEDRLLAFTTPTANMLLDTSLARLRTEKERYPDEFILWQSFAYAIIETHGLLDEYLRACFELLAAAEQGAEAADVRTESETFARLSLRDRLGMLRSRFGVRVRFGRTLERGLEHHRNIRNGIVHGQLTPQVTMPDGSIGVMHNYPPPPYVPLGYHIVRGAMSVVLGAHEKIDRAVCEHLGIPEDAETLELMDVEIDRGREDWFVDPWEPHPEHIFDAQLLAMWRPGT